MTGVYRANVKEVFRLSNGSWISRTGWSQEDYFYIIHPDGSKELISVSEDSQDARIAYDNSTKQFVIIEDYDQRLKILWQELGKVKKQRLVDDFDNEHDYCDRRNAKFACNCHELKEFFKYSLLDLDEETFYRQGFNTYDDLIPSPLLIPEFIKQAIINCPSKNVSDLFIVDLNRGESKVLKCPFRINLVRFNSEGNAILVCGRNKFFVLDNPLE